ncbi:MULTISPECIES: type I-E CRISPR-associated protein Cse2/CasB [Streptomyces]|uniref:Type I-E CRISPR-associated protein Cse2/CasB n=1 Tax=Streptomyces doudnae TaxID=3075536 RepID=A0ABD5EFE8_9ACTN|nr:MULTISPECIES: type I-E CRISPR-associated protein Cse2/CasB [unclassified Streptomyces]MDT0433315.1 type I-E CRISPR-associated protein Cse2/CasB [Streptomyces sp. DSM 41981]MYQ68085.1 type I-E CRISPR-associated protein Cse2/CasB [Streptomyces sp. SID4950]SCE42904.1 CRISPR system Cascade subunit CasB [Streptomyces sp. SolWspMP-5a-2]
MGRTTSSPPAKKPRPALSLPRRSVLRTIGKLQTEYRSEQSWAVGAVAQLRREAGRDAHTSPSAWGLIHLEDLTHLREQEQASAADETPGRAEPRYFTSAGYAAQEQLELREDTAVHLAVTLWALHQQSIRDASMHMPAWPLGRAVRRLAHQKTGTHDTPATASPPPAGQNSDRTDGTSPVGKVEEASDSVRRRFVRIGVSSDTDVLGSRLREMTLLLRAARIPLDYGLLADQLLRWQDHNQQDDVRRSWGREYHRRYPSSPEGADKEAAAPGSGEQAESHCAEDLESADADT